MLFIHKHKYIHTLAQHIQHTHTHTHTHTQHTHNTQHTHTTHNTLIQHMPYLHNTLSSFLLCNITQIYTIIIRSMENIRYFSFLITLLSWWHMWPDLRKATFYAHNIKTHFSPLNNSCTHWLRIQVGIDAESYPGCFSCGLFLRPVRRPRVLGWPSDGYISPWQADSRL